MSEQHTPVGDPARVAHRYPVEPTLTLRMPYVNHAHAELLLSAYAPHKEVVVLQESRVAQLHRVVAVDVVAEQLVIGLSPVGLCHYVDRAD